MPRKGPAAKRSVTPDTVFGSQLVTRLINKVLHTPTRRLKDAASTGREPRLVETIRHLFGLGDEP